MQRRPKPVVLIILDGWGYSEESAHNPTKSVATPTLHQLFETCPNTLIEASGEAVGLPKGQIGNSEVGHLHIGSGRKVPQDLTRIDHEIQNGKFFQNPLLLDAIQQAKDTHKKIHILGLVSPGGVHSHERQLLALTELFKQQNFKDYYWHAILDGRDVPPKSAIESVKKFPHIVSVIGRYYAMDRDKRWERTQIAYDLLTLGKANFSANTAEEAVQQAYARGESDEFVKPTLIHAPGHQPTLIEDGDLILFMNFRPDRARQLSYAFTEDNFDFFPRTKKPNLGAYLTLTQYAKNLKAQKIYPPLQLHNTLGEYLSNLNLTQLRIAETEKYAHVTYFLNGGVENNFPKEDRILIPSPKVATYDLQPEMSAHELTEKLVQAIESQKYDVIMCNYANPDMVGHTGIEPAAEQAVSVMDDCLKEVLSALQKVGGEALITSDHGNIEYMFDPQTGQPHTAHTTNPVPLIYVGRPAHFLKEPAALDNVAPTLLYILGLQQPMEMTGKNLLRFSDKA